MIGENKNLKDPEKKSMIPYGTGQSHGVSNALSYTKTNKLITALFMVTDIMDKEEPIRGKIRSLGLSVLSDMYINPAESDKKISEILVLLDITKDTRMASEMNVNILKREFEELLKSVRDYSPKQSPIWLEEFLKDEDKIEEDHDTQRHVSLRPSGHIQSTRIGVQKGSTLLKALKGVTVSHMRPEIQHAKKTHEASLSTHTSNHNYEALKGKRREEIISIIKNKLSVFPDGGGATITDIKNSAEGPLVSCGEKTLQRELISMVQDGVLYKTGEKRWSKYSTQKA